LLVRQPTLTAVGVATDDRGERQRDQQTEDDNEQQRRFHPVRTSCQRISARMDTAPESSCPPEWSVHGAPSPFLLKVTSTRGCPAHCASPAREPARERDQGRCELPVTPAEIMPTTIIADHTNGSTRPNFQPGRDYAELCRARVNFPVSREGTA